MDIEEFIADLFLYHKEEPMLFNSGAFIFFFTLFYTGYIFIKNSVQLRLLYVVSFSCFFYYKASGAYLFVLLATILIDFYLARWIFTSRSKQEKKVLLWISLMLNLGLLGVFKYANFIASNVFLLVDHPFTPLSIFLPIGISFYTFQSISYTVDVYRGSLEPRKTLLEYAFYMTFFPHLVAGPIVRAKDFLPQIQSHLLLNAALFSEALYLITKGLFKKTMLADYAGQYADIVYANVQGYSSFEHLIAMYAYTLQIYGDFSGYTDMAIGVSLLLGYRLGENFRNPYQARNLEDFWRRWHISLSSFLRDYIYIPLGGNRKGPYLQAVYLMTTMLIGGLWHGASWNFVLWGGMHGLGLCIHKVYASWNTGKDSLFIRVLHLCITFHFVAILWVFFRVPNFGDAWYSVHSFFTSMDFSYLPYFWTARKSLMILLGLGYFLLWIPENIKVKIYSLYEKSPFIVKIILLLLCIQGMYQFKNEAIQPFIYFQF